MFREREVRNFVILWGGGKRRPLLVKKKGQLSEGKKKEAMRISSRLRRKGGGGGGHTFIVCDRIERAEKEIRGKKKKAAIACGRERDCSSAKGRVMPKSFHSHVSVFQKKGRRAFSDRGRSCLGEKKIERRVWEGGVCGFLTSGGGGERSLKLWTFDKTIELRKKRPNFLRQRGEKKREKNRETILIIAGNGRHNRVTKREGRMTL